MKEQVLTIKKIEKVTHNVLRFTLTKSNEFTFLPGQAADVVIDKDGWREDAHPFTFTSLPMEDHLEFTIKIYPEHSGVTNELSKLKVGNSIIIKDVFGTIQFKGKGTFIAGGAGVTPFIAILRDLNQKNEITGNRLILANSKKEDIINQTEFESILGDNFLNILSKEDVKPYAYGRINTDYLKDHIASLDGYFYICGPEPMMDSVEESLKTLGIKDDQIIKEKF